MGNTQAPANRPQEPGTNVSPSGFFATLSRTVLQIMIVQMVINFFGRNSNNQQQPYGPDGIPIHPLRNYFKPAETFDVFVHLVNDETGTEFDNLQQNGKLVWFLENDTYVYSRFAPTKSFNLSIPVIREFLEDTSLGPRLCVSLVPLSAYHNDSIDIADKRKRLVQQSSDNEKVVTSCVSLLEKMKPFIHAELKSLVGIEDGDSEELPSISYSAEQLVKHFKSRFDIGLVYDTSSYFPASIGQEPLKSSIRVHPMDGYYHPILEVSDFWMLEDDYIPLNETIIGSSLQLKLSYGIQSQWYWMILKQMDMSTNSRNKFGFYSQKETLMLKRIILNTNIYMLVFSSAFILLHSVFSFFALKNDVQFWYRNESMQGLSALSVIMNFICEVIIALYLFDSEETSWLIMVEIFIGVALSAWKVTKAVTLEIIASYPFIKIKDAKNYRESNTKKYDETAIRFMSTILMPSVVAYAMYALYYKKFKSWYSYIISTLAGAVYTFGFIMMAPQLYINYKLKSVDHLPWRALIYKSLNTFVDDVASFLVDMPMLHRLSCFRDDIIFILYLYQRWIYRVDKQRSISAVSQEQDMLPSKENISLPKGELRRRSNRSVSNSHERDTQIRYVTTDRKAHL